MTKNLRGIISNDKNLDWWINEGGKPYAGKSEYQNKYYLIADKQVMKVDSISKNLDQERTKYQNCLVIGYKIKNKPKIKQDYVMLCT